ncbi:hypothetical protein R3P38DRAFT_1116603 [Favolaschia claudopus]|uniref:Restriction of telomere capping protein 4 n=1 Tax=Favolaschia claudopus TaxID=2862362 RepID=A0AAW0B8G8_9AGAR
MISGSFPDCFSKITLLIQPTRTRCSSAVFLSRIWTFMSMVPNWFEKPRAGTRRTSGVDIRKIRSKGCPFPISAKEIKTARKWSRLSNKVEQLVEHTVATDGNDEVESIAAENLCPFCDRALPLIASPFLVAMLEKLVAESQPDPRPTNSLGRKMESSKYGAVCNRHEFENEELPKAIANKWPTTIDWDTVHVRVTDLKEPLNRILLDDDLRPGGPRDRCVFWTEYLAGAASGRRAGRTGVLSELSKFDKWRPGYYGEQGAQLFQKIMYTWFPPTRNNELHSAPLNTRQFIEQILVPEIGMRLIAEDLGLDNLHDAIEVLRASSKYGAGMFPADGEQCI